jgi:hypothetical protein
MGLIFYFWVKSMSGTLYMKKLIVYLGGYKLFYFLKNIKLIFLHYFLLFWIVDIKNNFIAFLIKICFDQLNSLRKKN